MFLINLLKNEFDSGLGGCVSAIEGRTSTTAHTRVKGEKGPFMLFKKTLIMINI